MTRTIKLNHITKIEGHASLAIKIDNGKILKCELSSVEGARFFEGIVVGKHYTEAKEITSRICGICSASHAVAALKAIENAAGIKVSNQTKILRELLMIGERIRSHASHLYFLALPDYLGYESGIEMARDNKKLIDTALALIRLGNNIVEVTSGRDIHPISPVVGGFTHVPSDKERLDLRKRLKKALPFAKKTAKLFLGLDYPDFENRTQYVSLSQKGEFPLISGDLVTMQGFLTKQKDYLKHFKEYLELYSSCKFAVKDGMAYVSGALSRINTNYEELNPESRRIMDKSKIRFPSFNPFHNNAAQAVEIVHWIEAGIMILDKRFRFEGLPKHNHKPGRGISCVEAPRGILFHDYTVDAKGIVTKCNIITPTCQNLRNIEEDIRKYLPRLLKKKKDEIILEIEKLIRAYDPCFSCSTHFLKVRWE